MPGANLCILHAQRCRGCLERAACAAGSISEACTLASLVRAVGALDGSGWLHQGGCPDGAGALTLTYCCSSPKILPDVPMPPWDDKSTGLLVVWRLTSRMPRTRWYVCTWYLCLSLAVFVSSTRLREAGVGTGESGRRR